MLSVVVRSVLGFFRPWPFRIGYLYDGLRIQAQQPFEFANTADAVLIGSVIDTRNIAKDDSILDRLTLNTADQLVSALVSYCFRCLAYSTVCQSALI